MYVRTAWCADGDLRVEDVFALRERIPVLVGEVLVAWRMGWRERRRRTTLLC